MFATFLRILIGVIFAYLAAAATKILFTFPPNLLQTMSSEQVSTVMSLIPKSAVRMAIFSLPLALIVMAVGERRRWRDWAYYAASAIILSLIGFFSIYLNETNNQGWSITSSNYPLIAFLTTGFVGGIVYWLFSGRLAGGVHAPHRDVHAGNRTTPVKQPAASGARH